MSCLTVPHTEKFWDYQIFLNNIEMEEILSMDYNNSEEVFLLSISIYGKMCIIPCKFEVNFGPLKKLLLAEKIGNFPEHHVNMVVWVCELAVM